MPTRTRHEPTHGQRRTVADARRILTAKRGRDYTEHLTDADVRALAVAVTA